MPAHYAKAELAERGDRSVQRRQTLMSVLHKILLLVEGEKPKLIYRKIYELQVECSLNQPR